MFKPKLFGRNIKPSCEYCANCTVTENNTYICSAKKQIINERCSKFRYDPLMRKPFSEPVLPKYSEKDFTL